VANLGAAQATRWSACDVPVAGCRQLEPRPAADVRYIRPFASVDSAGTKWISVSFVDTASNLTTALATRLDGALVFGARTSSEECSMRNPALGSGRLAGAVISPIPGVDPNQAAQYFYFVKPLVAEAPLSWSDPFLPGGDIDVAPVAPSNGRAAVYFGGGSLRSFDWDAPKADVVVAGGATLGELLYPTACPDGYLVSTLKHPYSIFRSDGTTPAVNLFTDATGDSVYPAYSSGVLAWFRGQLPTSDLTWAKVSILVSPYAPGTTALSPNVLVDDIGFSPRPLVAGAGRVATATKGAIHVWRVSDGEHRVLELPATTETWFRAVVALFDDEIIFARQRYDQWNGIGGIYRVPYESLAQVPPP
jgi:hypothetical protein